MLWGQNWKVRQEKQSDAMISYVSDIHSAREKAVSLTFDSKIKTHHFFTKYKCKKYSTFPFFIVFLTNIHSHSQNMFF